MNWDAVSAHKQTIAGRPVWICRPAAKTDRAMVFYHGWSSTAKLNLFRARILAAHGYWVLVPEAVHHGERGTLEYDDPVMVARYMFSVIDQSAAEFSDLAAWLLETGIRQTVVAGHSMGGFTAAQVFARYPEVDVCVNMNGSFAFQEAAEGMMEKADPQTQEAVKAAFVPYRTDPQKRTEALVNRPILLLSGGADAVIDPDWQASFYDRLRTRYEEKAKIRRIVYPHVGHVVTTNMLEDLLAFAEEQLEEKP